MSEDLVQRYLDRFDRQLDTRVAITRRDALENCWQHLDEVLDSGSWLVAADDNTWEAAGERFGEALDREGQEWSRFPVGEVARHDPPICTDRLVDACETAMRDRGCAAAVAVGSGTINDTVKMAAHRLGRPMAVVGTAPSMNGYTSGVAAILSDRVKTTNPCTAPRAVVADLDVMAEAPSRMIASGFGDLVSKPVSNSDWAISAALNGTPHSEDALEIIEQSADALEGVPPHLQERDREALRGLVQSLLLSGIAMSVAGSSSPASGGEHLVSHYIDMTAYTFDQPHDLHGCQVGVGTLVAASLYERLADFDPASVDVETRVDALADWATYDAELRDRFGPLYSAVVEHARPAYPTEAQLRGRLDELTDRWDEIMDEAERTLRTRDAIEKDLEAAGAPTRFVDLGVDRDRARRAVLHSRDIRNRYTILDLCWELGVLEEWGTEVADALYD